MNSSQMNLEVWLIHATRQLQDANIASARLDALILLEDLMDKDRSWLLAHPEHDLDDGSVRKLAKLLNRRAAHEPLAYIRGKSEFYSREFKITPATLQPRPETETMIEVLKQNFTGGTIADIGTGSGCLAITAKLEFPDAVVQATELNIDALKVARENALRLMADVEFHQGNLLEPIQAEVDILLCNLPYVPDSHTINQSAMQEPKIAIFGGEDGLDLYRRMFLQIDKLPAKPSIILTESLPFQHPTLQALAVGSGYIEIRRDDFIQLFKLA